MHRRLLILCFAAILAAAQARGFDLPIDLGFQLGFNIQVVPGPNDTSSQLGLVVATHQILSDKEHSLVITGTITNFSDVQYDNVDMQFAVTSYVGTGVSRGRATVQPSTIPPGSSASFSAHISLDSVKPRHAMYTITAQTPVLYDAQPSIEAEPGSSNH